MVPATHEPIPLQTSLVCMPLEHVVPHDVLDVAAMQLPEVSQPEAPHGAAPAMHGPEQQLPVPVVPQTPLVHSMLELHALPGGAPVSHTPLDTLHAKPVAQSLTEAHVVLQLVAPHAYGEHGVVVGAQAPLPLQLLVVAIPFEQLGLAPHDMLLPG